MFGRTTLILHAFRLVCLCAFVLGAGALNHAVIAQEQQQGDGSRQIVAEEFTRSRPEKSKTSSPASRPSNTSSSVAKPKTTTSNANTLRRPRYKRRAAAAGTTVSNSSSAGSGSASSKTGNVIAAVPSAKVGVTIWRLRPAQAADQGARLLVQDDASELVPERVGTDMQLKVRDRVRLTIESPREGYLYVVDRELYSDGTKGEPYLIFPTTRTRGGDNRVGPGKLIDIPAQEDKPNYFTLIPSPGREDQVGEVLSIIVTTEPLENFQPTGKPLKLASTQVENWEKTWGGTFEQYDLEGGEGQTWTQAESEASKAGAGSRYLTQEEPTPQTIYLIEAKNNKGLLVTVPLRYQR